MRFCGMVASLVTGLALAITPSVGSAQSQLNAAITVNDRAITGYEIDQRRRLLEVFNTVGNIDTLAREGLIDDRLKQQEMARFNRSISEDALQLELEAFAARGNLSLQEFVQVLAQNGVDPGSFVAYISVGVMWRDYIRARYNREVTVTDTDIDRALARQGSAITQLEVLLSEIIIPAPPERAARVQEVAQEISRMRSFDAFSDAARQVSALPSRELGGRLNWRPIDSYPPQLRQQLLDLSPGEVTEPIDIPGAVALFQKRGQREARRPVLPPVSIEYAAYYLAGGLSADTLRVAREVATRVDTCDDLYGVARDQPAEVLDRVTLPPDQISQEIGLELARLDPGEVSYNLTRNNGETLVFLMLCARNNAGAATLDRRAISNQIRSQRLSALADALVADLRADAQIRP